jgi:hypothetical protein
VPAALLTADQSVPEARAGGCPEEDKVPKTQG